MLVEYPVSLALTTFDINVSVIVEGRLGEGDCAADDRYVLSLFSFLFDAVLPENVFCV